jgi:Protein of unknown function (DUF2946)
MTPDTFVCCVCSSVYVAVVSWESGGHVRTQRLEIMKRLRSRPRSCTQLALFALAAQIVLSFGHMHRDDLGLSLLRVSHETQITSGTADAVGSADQDHHPASDDYCPICVSVGLVATALLSLPPVLVEPVSMRRERLSETSVQRPSIQIWRSFQARAPPVPQRIARGSSRH